MSLFENMSLSLSCTNIFHSFVTPLHIKLHIDFTNCLSTYHLESSPSSSHNFLLTLFHSQRPATYPGKTRETPLLNSHGKEDKTAITRPSSTISKIGCSLSLALIFSINPRAIPFFLPRLQRGAERVAFPWQRAYRSTRGNHYILSHV